MRLRAAIAAVCLSFGLSGGAEADELRPSVNSMPGWEAVGRLNIAGRNMCTGSLIANNLVLTAAHCLFDPSTGRRVDPRTIKFEAGLNGQRVKASRTVTKAVLHPGYRTGNGGVAQIGSDLAVLRLNSPISAREIRPLDLSWHADRGDVVGVLSYSHTRATRPNLERGCQVLAKQHQTLVMSCRVDYGASGSPVFEVTAGHAPRLVSVISSKAAIGTRRVSLGSVLDGTLRTLMQRAG
ncbi:trypsin-like serine protease [Phaeobacter sp. CAU 1743]|uniref:trypsin-like serine peptidase n=1 Tax=Phaeobacter sp. CAU 1743 TaxID=3140367 RepID=UPI00325BD0A7